MSRLVEWMLRFSAAAEARTFESATREPAAAQERILHDLLKTNAATAFGRAHGFAHIANAHEYVRAVPLSDYEAVRPYMNRVIAGERNVLTVDTPEMFAATSGTTAKPKLIPVTARSRAQNAAMTRMWLARAIRDHRGGVAHKALTIVSPAVEGLNANGKPYGAMSGITYRRIPWIVRRHSALPYALALIADYQTRYFLAMRIAMAQRVSMIATPNPSTFLRLARVADENAAKIIRAIHDGEPGIAEWSFSALAGEATSELLASMKPDRARARFLEQVINRTGHLRPREVWPELQLIGCWLGGSAGFQADQLTEFYGDVPRRDLGLWASEGRMTLPLADDTASGVLAVHANFYEFIPEENAEGTPPRTLRAHQLERGRRYCLVISAANGLYRYNMNDIVEVTGFYNRTPLLAFVRKGGDMASITGEKIHLNQVQCAIEQAERAVNTRLHQFRIIPDLAHRRYELLVEFSGAMEICRRDNFLHEFDRALAAQNREYASRRASRRLDSPKLWEMRPGWSDRVAREDFRAGKREAQYKWRHLVQQWDPISRAEIADPTPPPSAFAS